MERTRTPTLRIELSEEQMERLNEGRSVTIKVQPAGASLSSAEPKPGSLQDQVIHWAKKRKKFTTPQLAEALGMSRAHAAMIISKLANGLAPIVRLERGVYAHEAKVPA